MCLPLPAADHAWWYEQLALSVCLATEEAQLTTIFALLLRAL